MNRESKIYMAGFAAGVVVTATLYDLHTMYQAKKRAERTTKWLSALKEALKENDAVIKEAEAGTMTENDHKFWEQVLKSE